MIQNESRKLLILSFSLKSFKFPQFPFEKHLVGPCSVAYEEVHLLKNLSHNFQHESLIDANLPDY